MATYMEHKGPPRGTYLPWWNSARESDRIPYPEDDNLTRIEESLPAFLQVERRLEEIGGRDWKGVVFRNAVLAASGWHPAAAVSERDREQKLSAYRFAHRMLNQLGWRPTPNQVRAWLRQKNGGFQAIPGDGPRSWRDLLDALEERTHGMWRVVLLAFVWVLIVWLGRELFL
jgi:hypothetical protein